MSATEEKVKSASTSSLVTALVLNAAIFGVKIHAFAAIRRSFPSIYEPRARFLPEGLISWAVLLPVDSVSLKKKDGLDQFTFGNIPQDCQIRYAAHLVLAWFLTFWVMYNVKKEMLDFAATRHRHLVDPTHSSSAQANTGGVKKAWLNRNLKELPDIYDRRLTASKKLETAEFKLVAIANNLHRQYDDALGKATKKGKDATTVKPVVPDDVESPAPCGSARSSWPTSNAPPPTKVDTIDWARREVAEADKELMEGRKNHADDRHNPGVDMEENYPPLNSAFIFVNQQIGTHIAAQITAHNKSYWMGEKYTEVM
ncbi:hypothetical protein FRC09_017611 [Ceratobasidium sp. 395]|nr:hypothetical protein FRC09_017611 [Ceratobasidium sp. 395]